MDFSPNLRGNMARALLELFGTRRTSWRFVCAWRGWNSAWWRRRLRAACPLRFRASRTRTSANAEASLLLRFDEAGHDEHAGRLEHVRRWQRLRNGLDSHLTRRRQPANLSAYVRPRNARREQMLDLPPSLDSTRLEQRRRILFVQVRSYLAQIRSDSSTWR